MLFNEALAQLQASVPMRRASWPTDEGYLQLMAGMKHVWKIMLVPNPNAGNFIFSVEDFLADDWIAFEEPKPAIEELKPIIIETKAETEEEKPVIEEATIEAEQTAA